MKRSREAGAWFRQPVVWLGAAILAASLLGCIATIVLASRHADAPVDTGAINVLKMPLRHSADVPLPAQESR